MVNKLLDYSKETNITLKLNENDKYGRSPLLSTIKNDNKEMDQLLINYTEKSIIILKLNSDDNNEYYPILLLAIKNNNKDIVNLLINYAIEKRIDLKLNKKK
ncbi:hypothetical protein LY90DRAFT_510034 [Neocallimastix californiae]|uniref:Uncharacterized protein n=1 Tax=Neocallimastix californiae TaxID=1754190 RepID=A0A1Y2C5C1_9FUNG|nr:hypothetical protein LY90DRAFT_510034 [Neocallimastix californiae]|eukprot:ORY42077.1 hypothetical protein LY90DRAFT_510034 [Neocallimastix californiae]